MADKYNSDSRFEEIMFYFFSIYSFTSAFLVRRLSVRKWVTNHFHWFAGLKFSAENRIQIDTDTVGLWSMGTNTGAYFVQGSIELQISFSVPIAGFFVLLLP